MLFLYRVVVVLSVTVVYRSPAELLAHQHGLSLVLFYMAIIEGNLQKHL